MLHVRDICSEGVDVWVCAYVCGWDMWVCLARMDEGEDSWKGNLCWFWLLQTYAVLNVVHVFLCDFINQFVCYFSISLWKDTYTFTHSHKHPETNQFILMPVFPHVILSGFIWPFSLWNPVAYHHLVEENCTHTYASPNTHSYTRTLTPIRMHTFTLNNINHRFCLAIHEMNTKLMVLKGNLLDERGGYEEK